MFQFGEIVRITWGGEVIITAMIVCRGRDPALMTDEGTTVSEGEYVVLVLAKENDLTDDYWPLHQTAQAWPTDMERL